ncbi:MAG: hypothetical protein Kow006_20680 [Gammaproteobacteria bacterium]
MSAHQFQIVFLGTDAEGHAAENVRAAMSAEFELNPALLDHLFSGRPVVVKRRIDAETAVRYKYLIDALGGIARIEPMPFRLNAPDQPGFVELRERSRRWAGDRRAASRAISYLPERRQGNGRRAVDY